jgi:hypothetical protein
MDQTNPIPGTAVVAAVKGHVFCELDGEAVILHLQNGIYYGLNSVGNTVWNYLQQPRTVGQVLSHLLDSFEVDAARCQAGLQELLASLLRAGLIEVTAEVSQ